MQHVLLAMGTAAGLLFAYGDSLPTWDDTGVMAGALLLTSGLLALLGYRRPWLIALTVGGWIPLHQIYRSHDVRMIVIVLIPLAGAYLGWAVRRGVHATTHG